MFRRNGNLENALAHLMQNQALLAQSQIQLAADMAQIRKDYDEIIRILLRHEQFLANLPEAIKEKIGFKQ